jgi:hypothetical protein
MYATQILKEDQMNILDEEFAEFQKLPTEERIGCFEKNGRLFDMIRSQQLNREIIDDIYRITNHRGRKSEVRCGS